MLINFLNLCITGKLFQWPFMKTQLNFEKLTHVNGFVMEGHIQKYILKNRRSVHVSDLSQDSSSGQVMSKVYMSCVQSERTLTQCSLQGWCTCVCCVHSGTKAWHRNKCTSGEQCRLTSGMKCCKCKKQRGWTMS